MLQDQNQPNTSAHVINSYYLVSMDLDILKNFVPSLSKNIEGVHCLLLFKMGDLYWR